MRANYLVLDGHARWILLSAVRRQDICDWSGLFRREDGAHLLNRLGGYSGVHQASVLNGLSFDPFSFQQDGVAVAEVNIGRCQVGDGLVVTLVVVVIDEGIDLGLEIARQIVVLEQDAVLQRLVSALDLSLGLGMEGSAPDVADAAVLEPFREIAGDVRGTVVAQQAWPIGKLGARAA